MYIITRLAANTDCLADRSCVIDSKHPPTRIHWSLINAKEEALRLAEKHPGMQFIIFQATDAVICPVTSAQWLVI